MNCKLEKFWNDKMLEVGFLNNKMNCKLEKFWNKVELYRNYRDSWKWTVNLKSFEIIE